MKNITMTIKTIARKVIDDLWWSIPFIHYGWKRVSKTEFKKQYVQFRKDFNRSYRKEWQEKFEKESAKYPVYLVKKRTDNSRHLFFYRMKNKRCMAFWTKEQALGFEQHLEEVQTMDE